MRIHRYIPAIAFLAFFAGALPAHARGRLRLGPDLRRMRRGGITPGQLDEQGRRGRIALRRDGARRLVRVLVHAEGDALAHLAHLARMGAKRVERFGDVYAADVPVDAMDGLAAMPGLVRARTSRRMRIHLDESVPTITGLNLPRTPVDEGGHATYPPSNWGPDTGAGVIVGIVDSGVDYDYPDFEDDGDVSRVRAIWDQNTGLTWDAAEIQAGVCTEMDENGHGSHVAGIAAGTGKHTENDLPAYRYVGVAPEADIVAVATDFYDDTILAGVAWVFEKADEWEQPAVVNLSLGGHSGPHDGTDPFDVALDAMVGPGRIVVASAGNEGNDFIHAGADWAGDDVVVNMHSTGGHSLGWIDITLWHDGGDSYQLQLTSPKGGPTSWDPGESGEKEVGRNVDVTVSNPGYDETSYNGDKEIAISVFCRVPEGTWEIRLVADTMSAEDPDRVDAWIWYDSYSTEFTSGDAFSSVGTPGTARSVITVGAYTTKNAWTDVDGNPQDTPYVIDDITPFSSAGPTRDGRLKPDICAPGSMICSAGSYDATYYTSEILEDGVHVAMQGTSMSAPHITGLVALLLARQPDYDPEALKSILAYSATRDSWVGASPSNTWGYGKADAEGALAAVDEDLPRCAGVSLHPVATEGATLVACPTGFEGRNATSPARYLYRWEKHDGARFERIAGAEYNRLEASRFAAGDRIRVVVTPCEYVVDPSGYEGLVLGTPAYAEQTVASGASHTSQTLTTEWNAVSIPTQDDAGILSDFAGSFYEWREDAQSYQTVTTLERGRGYWVNVAAGEGSMHSDGPDVPAEDFTTGQLTYTTDPLYRPGRHLLGNPYNYPIYWQNVLVSTDRDTFTYRVTDPGAAALIHNVYYTDYDNATGAYQFYDPEDPEEHDGTIFPWQSFWVVVKQPVYLRIPEVQTAPGEVGPGGGEYPAQSVEESRRTRGGCASPLKARYGVGPAGGEPADSWRLKLSAVSDSARDDYNYLGVSPGALDGYDPSDVLEPGTLNSARHVLMFVDHDDWGERSGRYCVDMRGAGRPVVRWTVTLVTKGLAEDVTLMWRGVPAGWRLSLDDPVADAHVDMTVKRSYALEVADGERTFVVTAHRSGGASAGSKPRPAK